MTDHVENLVLAGGEGHQAGPYLASSDTLFVVLVRQLQSAADRCQQNVIAERFLDEIDRAALHRLDRQRHISVTGDHDNWHVAVLHPQLLEQLDTAHAR